MSAAQSDLFPYPAGPGGTVPPRYSRLLAEEPVSRVRLADDSEMFLVTRDSDVRTVLTDPAFSRHAAAVLPGSGLGRGQGTGIVDVDPPQHTVLRNPVVSAFSPGRVARWRPRIEAIADELLLQLTDEREPVDLVRSYTAPFAGRVVTELLGFEGTRWRDITGDVETLLMSGGAEGPETDACRARLHDAFTTLLKERGRDPADDVVTVLLGLDEPEAGGGSLTDTQRITLLHGLVISGYIGIRDLLARHLYGVLTAPEARDRLVAHPDLVPGAVAELLRFYPSSNDGLLRLATRDVELSGFTVPAGSRVLPLVSAACRDPRVVDRPDELVVDRAEVPTLAFGAGPHQCPAADLARVQLSTGIGRLLAAYPSAGLAVAAEGVVHTSELLPLGVAELLVRLRAPA
ncbi:cytochrome P450 [Streptomyces sp. NBC_01023]|uniref:cytochrome P450 n=1 Tax=Streptomyces sp. NBC_01023 TaxID=2903724 RepID=UPI003863F701|nr:cytochrome P450 [Streptomyces sp. NBC_01023]